MKTVKDNYEIDEKGNVYRKEITKETKNGQLRTYPRRKLKWQYQKANAWNNYNPMPFVLIDGEPFTVGHLLTDAYSFGEELNNHYTDHRMYYVENSIEEMEEQLGELRAEHIVLMNEKRQRKIMEEEIGRQLKEIKIKANQLNYIETPKKNPWSGKLL